MQLSRKTDYALRTVLDLAQHPNRVVSVHKIAERQGISTNFLEQILLVLKGAGIVASRRGKHGGYYLARKPDRISLAEVVELTEGSLEVMRCDGENGCPCPNAGACPIHEVWTDLGSYIRTTLADKTVGMLRDRAAELRPDEGTSDYII